MISFPCFSVLNEQFCLLTNRKYSLSIDNSNFCYEQKDVSVSVMNRKMDYTTYFCWQQLHISLSVKQNFCEILGTVTMFLYVEQERITVVH